MGNNKTNVLLVEDNPVDAKFVQKLLNDSPMFEVERTDRLSAGIEYLENQKTDIIILDLTLPDSSGLDTFRRIYECASSVPIVILSSTDDESLAIRTLQDGAQDYLVKGRIDPNNLSRSLLFALERKKTEKTLRETTQELAATNDRLEKVIENSHQMALKTEMTSIELNQIFNTSPDGMWVLERNYNILRINDAFEKLLGKPKNDLLGKRCYEIFNNSVCQGPDCPMVLLKKKEKRVEVDTKTEEGTEFILTATSIKGWDGSISRIIENFKDITDRKRIEEELRQANQKLRDLSISDSLTQIANRRRFDECLDTEWKRLIREENSLSLILCDIDYFKFYNDTYGHQAGDDCLVTVAQTIKKNVKRPADLVARYGGEEFAVILPNTPAEGAMHLAEAIRAKILGLKIPHASSKIDQYITLSLGVACAVPQSNSLPENIIAAADKALYEAKEKGRNRVVLQKS